MLYRDFSTQEELDAQYNLREAVPEFPRYKEFYEEQSRETRERLECRLDVPYGPTLAEHLDVFPAGDSETPILIFFTADTGTPSAARTLASLLRVRSPRGLLPS